MKDFASDLSLRAKKEREMLLKALKTFAKTTKTVADLEPPDLNPVDTQQTDYQAYVRALYASLASCCLCPRQDGRGEITANLRLNICCLPGELEDSVNFRLFFLDHPHNNSDGLCQWQDTQIRVKRWVVSSYLRQ